MQTSVWTVNLTLKQTFHVLKKIACTVARWFKLYHIPDLIFMENLAFCLIEVARDEFIWSFSYIHLFKDSSMLTLSVGAISFYFYKFFWLA